MASSWFLLIIHLCTTRLSWLLIHDHVSWCVCVCVCVYVCVCMYVCVCVCAHMCMMCDTVTLMWSTIQRFTLPHLVPLVLILRCSVWALWNMKFINIEAAYTSMANLLQVPQIATTCTFHLASINTHILTFNTSFCQSATPPYAAKHHSHTHSCWGIP